MTPQRLVSLDNAKNDTLDIFLPDSCLTVNSTACIHTTTYIDTILLLFSINGYAVAYQRCCRNFDIVNIVNLILLELLIGHISHRQR